MSSSSSRETEALGCSGLAWSPGQEGPAGEAVPVGGRSRPERSNRAEVLPGVGKESQARPGGGQSGLRVPGSGGAANGPPTPHNSSAYPPIPGHWVRAPKSAPQVLPSAHAAAPACTGFPCLPPSEALPKLCCFCVSSYPPAQTANSNSFYGSLSCHFTPIGTELECLHVKPSLPPSDN